MNRELNATTTTDGNSGSQKRTGIVFSVEVRARLDAKLACVSVAQNDAERLAALEEYRRELEVARDRKSVV